MAPQRKLRLVRGVSFVALPANDADPVICYAMQVDQYQLDDLISQLTLAKELWSTQLPGSQETDDASKR